MKTRLTNIIKITLILSLAAVLALVPFQRVRAATVSVNLLFDELDGADGGACASSNILDYDDDGAGPDDISLREAICWANNNAGADVIDLAATSAYVLSLASTSEDGNLNGDLDISDDLTINGNYSSVSAAGIDRVFHIVSGGITVNLNAIQIENGDAGALDGGGIYNEGADLTLNDSTINLNTAQNGGGIYHLGGTLTLDTASWVTENQAAADGGGIYISTGGSLTIQDNVVVDNNQAAGSGGGIYISQDAGTTLLIEDSTLEFNVAGEDGTGAGYGSGGNIWNDAGNATLEIYRTLITDGVALDQDIAEAGGEGGCIFNDTNGDIYIEESQIEYCYADYYGGGIFNAGNVDITTSEFFYNEGFYEGGGIFNDTATATFSDVTFDNNSADYGGGMENYNSSPTLNNVTFQYNVAYDGGGGMDNYVTSSPTLISVTFLENEANYGGGISNEDFCSPSLTDVTFTRNTASAGAGISNINNSGPTLLDVTFDSNDAYVGGGMYNEYYSSPSLTNVTFDQNTADYGGGMENFDNSSPNLTNVTFYGNQAFTGGAIENDSFSSPTLTNVTISGNTATSWEGGGIANNNSSSPSLTNVILWGNTSVYDPAEIYNDTATGASATINYSVVQGGCTDGSTCTSLVTGSPLLGPLQNNGGLTETMALSNGSSAIDTGDLGSCPADDQRGLARPDGTGCDIGAYEFYNILTVTESNPANNARVTTLSTITVTFSEDVLNDGSVNAGNSLSNYLLVEAGVNTTFDTASCQGGLQADDTQITFSGVSYNPGTLTATLTLTTPLAIPLDNGAYRLFVCGTTSVWNADSTKQLNEGLSDSVISFFLAEAEALPETGFAPGMVTVLPAQPADKTYASTDLMLSIPSLGVEMEIVGVPFVNGTWDTTWLNQNSGWLEGSAFPTWEGNTVLTGHVWDANNNPGPFADIKDLQYGDQIIITAWGQTYVYEVRETELIFSGRVDKVFQHQEYDYLTLLTCETYNPVTGNYIFRRVVRAVLIEVRQ